MRSDALETIGSRIRRARRSRGWSDAAFARALGVRRTAVNYHETNRRHRMRPDTLHRLAACLGVRPEWLLTGEGPQWSAAEEDVGPRGGQIPIDNLTRAQAIGQRMRQARELLDWHQSDLAYGMWIPVRTIAYWEVHGPPERMIDGIAETLSVEVGWLREGSGEPPPKWAEVFSHEEEIGRGPCNW